MSIWLPRCEPRMRTSFFLAFERGRSETIDKVTHGEDDMTHPFSLSLVFLRIQLYHLAPWRLHHPLSLNPNLVINAEVLPSETNIVNLRQESRSVSQDVPHIPSPSSTVVSLRLAPFASAKLTIKLPSWSSRKAQRQSCSLPDAILSPHPHPNTSILASSPSGPLPSSSSSAPPPIPSSSSSAPQPIPSSSSSAPPPASPTPLRLYELAVLANTVHTAKPEYLLLSDNCYFYPGTIIKVLQERYNPDLKIETTGSEATDKRWPMLSWKGKGKELKAGDWHHFEIYAGEKVNTAPLIEKFEKDLADFKKPVRVLNVGSGQ
jgi:hypothetical protein